MSRKEPRYRKVWIESYISGLLSTKVHSWTMEINGRIEKFENRFIALVDIRRFNPNDGRLEFVTDATPSVTELIKLCKGLCTPPSSVHVSPMDRYWRHQMYSLEFICEIKDVDRFLEIVKQEWKNE